MLLTSILSVFPEINSQHVKNSVKPTQKKVKKIDTNRLLSTPIE